uniref:WGS project CAEQ00000000 data, annotated contig 309 n=1 Tax=Trypanosoma congolense (strain IL3000) TaxID=1068625 RepID=F9WES1_TRYCI|nr:unnamed protein product [Trypanosoma congolense IL3000]
MTDTEDDVRNAALGLLKVILHQWHSTKHLEGVNTTCDGVHSAMNSVVDTFDLDRSRAALQIVDVALTHAMMSVRRSGVELLELFLQVQPWGVQAVLSKSTDWVKMARRMSSIVLPSTSSGGSTSLMKMLHVVAKFLETMMPYEGDETEKWDADCMNLQHVTDERMCREKDEQGTSVLVAHFFEECAPRWAVAWKELMELRGSLFRDAEFVRRAAAIARSFACCAMYLQKHQLLTKNHLQLMHQLFVAKVPFTMHELVNNHREVECECSTSERSNRRRVELGNAIADACLPLAPSDNDALKVLRNFLSNSIDGLKGQCGMDGNHPNRAGSPRALHHIGPVRTLRTAMVRLSHRLLPRLASLVSPLLQVVTRTCSAGEEDAADRTLLVSVLMMSADIFASLVQSREVVQSSEGVAYVRSAVLAVPRMLFALRDLDVDSARLDRIVFSFLQPIWHVVSCGHPMLTTSVPSECVGKGERDEHTAQQQLAVSLTSLFEIHVPDEPNKGMCRSIEGVLRRCGDRTVELAVHTLFYVGGTVPRTSWARGDSILSFPVLIDTLPRPGYYASPSPDVATRAKST